MATRDECGFSEFWSSAAEGEAPPPDASRGGVAFAAISAPDQKPRARAKWPWDDGRDPWHGGLKGATTHRAAVLPTDPAPYAGEDNKGGLDELVADTNDAAHERTSAARTAIDLHCYEPMNLRKDRARAFTQSDG